MLFALMLLAAADTLPGQVLQGTHATEAGTREYRLYLPAAPAPPAGRPLLVMLHGCTQTAADFAAGTRADARAEEAGIVVLYPEQPATAHPQRCWSWYDPAHQQRGAGEPALIASLTRDVMREHGVDPARVSVAGVSAGGAMAATLAATYPELYEAVAVHSGVAHGAAADVAAGLAAMRGGVAPERLPALREVMGERARPVRAFLLHGADDAVVAPANLGALRAQWLALHSALGAPLAEEESEGRRRYRDARGREVLRSWLIPGVGHAWSGGSAAGSYTAPGGPDATLEIIRFFKAGAG